MKKFSLRRYTAEAQALWDSHAAHSRPFHFMFFRNYMDYHSGRFPDCSFFIEKNGNVVGLIPGTLSSEFVWSSHAGLTFGGILFDENEETLVYLEIFDLLDAELRKFGAKKVLYKPLPWIYHTEPSEASLYALFRRHAVLKARQVASVIDPKNYTCSENRRRKWKQALKEGVRFYTPGVKSFWKILSECLATRHEARPVHSLEEMNLLASRFPDHIRLCGAEKDGELLAGAVLYETPRVIHAQYLATTEKGRELGALDFLIGNLFTSDICPEKWLDLGTSCEQNGTILNEGLVRQKDGFGAHAVMFDQYEYEL
ncbi:MAG: GNAT family N-acetyltransferase [Fibrobacter sp.]|jgi:hypothetical protein|nr:GNAT family N-acetyltransferase [Fibrobacter sp.]